MACKNCKLISGHLRPWPFKSMKNWTIVTKIQKIWTQKTLCSWAKVDPKLTLGHGFAIYETREHLFSNNYLFYWIPYYALFLKLKFNIMICFMELRKDFFRNFSSFNLLASSQPPFCTSMIWRTFPSSLIHLKRWQSDLNLFNLRTANKAMSKNCTPDYCLNNCTLEIIIILISMYTLRTIIMTKLYRRSDVNLDFNINDFLKFACIRSLTQDLNITYPFPWPDELLEQTILYRWWKFWLKEQIIL